MTLDTKGAVAWTWKQFQECSEACWLRLCCHQHSPGDTPPLYQYAQYSSPGMPQFLSNATDSRNLFPSIQQLLEINIISKVWAVAASASPYPKDRWQNKSFLHKPSCFNYPVCASLLQDSSDKGPRKSQKSSWNTPVSILSLARKEGFVFLPVKSAFSQASDDLVSLLLPLMLS